VSIGSRRKLGGWSGSQASSTGHIVVRPGVAGSTRRPVSAKNSALISSDLPRENSATKASTKRSEASRCRTPWPSACAAASSRPCSCNCACSRWKPRSSARRQAARVSRRVSAALDDALEGALDGALAKPLVAVAVFGSGWGTADMKNHPSAGIG